METRTTTLRIAAWTMSFVVVGLALTSWLQGVNWQLNGLSVYSIFPLFGLLAFSLMWAHYGIGFLRHYFELEKATLDLHFEITSWIVLLALLFHPGLLIWQLWRDGFGLPPASYLQHYVAPGLGWVALLGTVSWFMFMAFEFRRIFQDSRWWPYVTASSDIAMVLVWYHAFRLGSQLQTGWMRNVWIFYGLTLAVFLGQKYWQLWRKQYAIV